MLDASNIKRHGFRLLWPDIMKTEFNELFDLKNDSGFRNSVIIL